MAESKKRGPQGPRDPRIKNAKQAVLDARRNLHNACEANKPPAEIKKFCETATKAVNDFRKIRLEIAAARVGGGDI